MYFLTRDYAWYRHIIPLSHLVRYGITSIILVAIWGLWFLSVHTMLESRVVQSQARIHRLRDQEYLSAQSKKEIALLEKSLAALQLEYDKLKKSISMHEQSAILAIITQAGTHGLSMKACTVVDQQKEQGYTSTALSVEVGGTCEQLVHFVQSLATTQHCIAMRHASLTNIDTHTHTPCTLQCRLDIITFE